MMKRNLFVGIFILLAVTLFGQDSVLTHYDMSSIEIIQPVRLRGIQSGIRIDVADSTISRLYAGGTLTDLLGGSGSMNVKTNSAGGLSTMAVRGSNSMQTPIVWNGVNLQNINNNTVDLSLLPVFLFDQISVQPGGSSGKWGSGAIGGVIQLSSYPTRIGMNRCVLRDHYDSHRIIFEAGSFGSSTIGFVYAGGRRNCRYDLKLYNQAAVNDFTFENSGIAGGRKDTLRHAGFQQRGAMGEVQLITQYNVYTLALWVQETNRELPPTMLQAENESTQQDYALRTIGSWFCYRFPFVLQTRVGLIHEGLVYDPGYGQPINNTNAWTAIAESEISYSIGERTNKWIRRTRISGGFIDLYNGAEVTTNIPYTTQNRFAVHGTVNKYFRTDDEVSITARIELVDGKVTPVVGHVWYALKVNKWMMIKTCVSKSYRIPTFNDLYWTPGGNRNLLPEDAWTEELTLQLKHEVKNFGFEYAVTAYNRNVTNMITWVPAASYWSPVNVTEVWSRGLEHRLKLKYDHHDWHFTLLGNLDYVRCTTTQSNVDHDPALGKQLIYVPGWFGGGSFTAEWKKYYITYAQSYTDIRFTTRDHSEWLPSYSITNIAVGVHQYIPKLSGNYAFNFFVKCNNLFNLSYQSVAWRPMPGVNFQFGCSINFEKQKNNT